MGGKFFTVFLLILFVVIISVFVVFSMHFYAHNELSQNRDFDETFNQMISDNFTSTNTNSGNVSSGTSRVK